MSKLANSFNLLGEDLTGLNNLDFICCSLPKYSSLTRNCTPKFTKIPLNVMHYNTNTHENESFLPTTLVNYSLNWSLKTSHLFSVYSKFRINQTHDPNVVADSLFQALEKHKNVSKNGINRKLIKKLEDNNRPASVSISFDVKSNCSFKLYQPKVKCGKFVLKDACVFVEESCGSDSFTRRVCYSFAPNIRVKFGMILFSVELVFITFSLFCM